MKKTFVCLILLFVAFPRTAAAEVMDKEPSLVNIWTWAFVGVLAALLWPFRWKFAFPLAVVSGSFFWGLLGELDAPYVGQDIVLEAGIGYVHNVQYATALVLGANLLGLLCLACVPSKKGSEAPSSAV